MPMPYWFKNKWKTSQIFWKEKCYKFLKWKTEIGHVAFAKNLF